MSHITRIKSQMVEREFVLRALDDLGCRYQTGNDVSIGGGLAPRRKVDIKVKRGWFRASIGLLKAGKHFEVLASADVTRRSWLVEFTRRLTQRYAYHAVREKLQAQGFELVTDEQREDGQLHLVLRRAG